MKLFENTPLSQYTTLKVGGPAKYLVIPESKEELIEIVAGVHSSNIPYAVIGNGSNLFVDDKGFDGMVILNTIACCGLTASAGITAGSGIKLAQLVRFCADHGRGGMEYLYSIPGTVGGAVFMNAGRGKNYQASIADHLVHVDIFDGKKQQRLTKKECAFKFRTSIFQRNRHWVILSAVFNPPLQPKKITEKKINERITLTRKFHDLQHPNAGSVFKKGFHDLKELRGLRIGDAAFSKKTVNWICNMGNATSKDIERLLNHARICHLKHGFMFPQLEWIDLNRYQQPELKGSIRNIQKLFAKTIRSRLPIN